MNILKLNISLNSANCLKKIISNCFSKHTLYFLVTLFGLIYANITLANPSNAKLTVWVSEAVVTTYTFDHKNFLKQQKQIAKYFTSEGWINFSKALKDSKIPDDVKKNSYYVSAVPTMTPEIKKLSDTEWQAVISVLVIYKNPSYKQKQSLKVTVDFVQTDREGVNGFAISRIRTIVTEPPCRCTKFKAKAVATIV